MPRRSSTSRESRPWVVLVVDADPIATKDVVSLLARFGCGAIEASTPAEARSRYTRLIDVAVVDVGPGYDGLNDLFKFFEDEDIPTIGVTNKGIQPQLEMIPSRVVNKRALAAELDDFFKYIESVSVPYQVC